MLRLNRVATPARRTPARRTPALRLEALEAREVPALTIQFDYSFDTSGFFNDPSHRAVLQQAATAITANVGSSLGGLAPGGGNTWTATFPGPSTGSLQSVANMSIAADTIVVFVGGRDLTGSEAGTGGYGGWSSSGYGNWNSYVANRGQAGFGEWGGSVSFDTVGTNWYFGTSGSVPSNAVDFYSVASHELGHLLGIGTATAWFANVYNGAYHGPTADAVYGGPVPVYGDSAHWANNLTVGGTRAALDPILPYGVRAGFSTLDFAALKDLGWSVPMFDGAALAYVQSLYSDILNRAGSTNEVQYWSGQIASAGRAGIASTIQHSAEAETQLVNGLYQKLLGRTPVGNEAGWWVNGMQAGATEEQVVAGLLASGEYGNRSSLLISLPSSSGDTNYVRSLYTMLLGRNGTAAEVDSWGQQLASRGRWGVASAILGSAEYRADMIEGMYTEATGLPGAGPLVALMPDLLHRPSASAADVQGWVYSGLDLLSVQSAIAGSDEAFAHH